MKKKASCRPIEKLEQKEGRTKMMFFALLLYKKCKEKKGCC